MKFTVKEKLKVSKGYPVTEKSFSKANSVADIKEKKKYPKGYEKLKKLIKKIPKTEILGHQTKKGKVTVSKRVPKKLRSEVAFHEVVEHKEMNKKSKKK